MLSMIDSRVPNEFFYLKIQRCLEKAFSHVTNSELFIYPCASSLHLSTLSTLIFTVMVRMRLESAGDSHCPLLRDSQHNTAKREWKMIGFPVKTLEPSSCQVSSGDENGKYIYPVCCSTSILFFSGIPSLPVILSSLPYLPTSLISFQKMTHTNLLLIGENDLSKLTVLALSADVTW